MAQGYQDKETEKSKKELFYVRRICWYLYAPNIDKKKPHAKNETELFEIPGEVIAKPKKVTLSKKQIDNLQAHLRKLNEK